MYDDTNSALFWVYNFRTHGQGLFEFVTLEAEQKC
jgi:hypothetical protein